MVRLKIRVLGGFEVLREAQDEPIRLHSRKLDSLLAYVAMGPGQGRSRETLATLLWDRSGEDQARASLRQALAVLRKSIDTPQGHLLVADRDRIALSPDGVWVDADAFQRLIAEGTIEALQQAVSLYRGRFLDGTSLPSSAFEEWVRGECQRLEDLALRALEKLLEHHGARADVDATVEVAHRMLAIDPLHEKAHRALIALGAEQGARGAAMEHFERYRNALQRELGLEPDAQTRALAHTLRPDEWKAVAARPAVAGSAGPRGAVGVDGLSVPATTAGVTGADDAPEAAYGGGSRWVTLLSCSLADAAAMSVRLDSEDLGKVIAAFRTCCERVIARCGGHVLHHHLGPSVSACFGYPRADEHGAERAVHAALEIVAQVGQLTSLPEPALRTCVGVASGHVVVTERALATGTREITVAGAGSHIVAALRTAAAPGDVLVASSTKTTLGALFECEDLGTRPIEGAAAPVRVWRVLAERRGPNRFAATRASATLAPLVGRDEDLDLLARRWQQARAGAGQVVVLVGEPGIGKSRLVEALRQSLRVEPVLQIAYYGSPHHQQSALYPVIRQLESAAGISRSDAPALKLDKLEALLAQAGGNRPGEVPLVADLLSIPVDERYPALDLTPQRRMEKTLEALVAQLVGLTRRQPVLMIFEDLHWSDPTTREFLDRLVESVPSLPVLVLVTHRPGQTMPWSGEPHVTSLVIRRLRRSDSEALVAGLVGEAGLPANVRAQIVDQADGVPLFLEELTKHTLDTGHAKDPPTRRAPDAVPDTLQDLLLARLDRLGPARTVAQEAAVIGRRFSYGLLEAVSKLKARQLQAALARLCEAELVHAQGTPPEASYSFKHALIQEAASASLLRSDRAPLHGRIAVALEERFPELKDAQPEVIAFHFASAGAMDKAVAYWHKAGELAMRRSAQREAITYFERAVAALDALPPGAARSGQELALRVLLGQAWVLAAGYAAPEVEAAYRRARDLCEELGDAGHLFFVLLGLWQLYVAKADVARATDVVDRLLPLAMSMNSSDFAIEAHVAQLVTLHTRGAFEEELAHANEAIARYDPDAAAGRIQRFGYDGYVIALTGAAWANWMLGRPDQALAWGARALETARAIGHPYSLAMAIYTIAWLHLYRREASDALRLVEESIALSIEHGFAWPEAYAAPVHGWALAELGRASQGVETIRKGLDALDRMGHRLWRPQQEGLLAAALARAGRSGEALDVLERAIDAADRTGDQENAAELQRLKGELTLRQGAPGAASQAERSFRLAIEIARRQHAKSWELRAATSLARLWREQDKGDQARQLLGPLHATFTEGFDTPDLQDAKALLDSLPAGAIPRLDQRSVGRAGASESAAGIGASRRRRMSSAPRRRTR